MKIKSTTQKVLLYALIMMIAMASVSLSALAEGPSISVETPVVEGKMITVEGSRSDNAVRHVSIFVLPEKINGTEMDSVDAMLTQRTSDMLTFYQNVVYMNSAQNSADNGFTFTFKVKEEGIYYIFMDSDGVVEFTPKKVQIKSIVESLAEAANEEDFKNLFLKNIDDTTAPQDTLNTIALFNNENKALLADYVYENKGTGYADKTALAAAVVAGANEVVEGVVSNLNSAADAEAVIEIIEANDKLIGVTMLEDYKNVLNDTERGLVKEAISDAGDFANLEGWKEFFDDAVATVIVTMKTEILGALNDAASAAEFGEKLLLYKDIIGLTVEQTDLLEKLSDEMCNTLYDKMMDGGNFTEYSQIPTAFDTAKAEIGENAIVLDIINNKEKSAAKIIEILYEFESLLTGLNKADYELLKDGENVYYQNQVKEKLLAGMPYTATGDVTQAFNTLVAEQKSAKETVTTLRSADYTTIQTIIGTKNAQLGISAAAYSDYQYIAGASSAKFTDLINTLLMYKEQYTDAGEFATIFAREVTAVKNSLPGGSDSSSGPSSSGRDSGKNIGSSTWATTSSGNANNKNTLFTDLTSVQWAEEQILYLADKGIVNGKGDKIFDPNGNVTREEFVKMLVCAFEIHNPDAVSDFTDCTGGAWYDSYVASAADKGIVMGRDNGSFGIGQNITREDMSVLVYRMLQSVKGFTAQPTDEVFDDNASISDYAAEGIYALKNAGYVSGMGNNMFAPKNPCTRAEAAVIIYNVIK